MSDILTLATKNTALVYETLNQLNHMVVWTDIHSKQIMANKLFLQGTGFNNLCNIQDKYYYDQPSEGAQFHDTWIDLDLSVINSNSPETQITYIKPCNKDDRRLYYGIRSPAYDQDGELIGTVQDFFDLNNSALISFIPFLQHYDTNRLITNGKGAFTYKLKKSFSNNKEKIKLTTRQSECLFFILRGKSAKEIAKILNISHRVVEHHTSSIHMKLGTFTKSQLIEKAIQLGFTKLIPTKLIEKLFSLSLGSLGAAS